CIFIATDLLAEFLRFDYGASGIVAMVLFFLVFNDRRRTMLMGLIAFLFEAPLYGTVYLSLPLIYQYNGKRGRGGRWFFYIFYPAHLLALYLLSLWI
ncbi:MAG: TraX family protein, partial [Aedoeadaptatus pacaensis]